MGRVFLEHMGGRKLYNCAECNANITNHDQLKDINFTGITGRAYLFEKAVNLVYSDVEERNMKTGHHFVRDVSCKNCDALLGWMYEFAVKEKERYKEGMVVLEKAMITLKDGLENEV